MVWVPELDGGSVIEAGALYVYYSVWREEDPSARPPPPGTLLRAVSARYPFLVWQTERLNGTDAGAINASALHEPRLYEAARMIKPNAYPPIKGDFP